MIGLKVYRTLLVCIHCVAGKQKAASYVYSIQRRRPAIPQENSIALEELGYSVRATGPARNDPVSVTEQY